MKVLKEKYTNFPDKMTTVINAVEGQALEDTKVFDKREEETNKEVLKNAKLPVDGAPKALKPKKAIVPNPINESFDDTSDADILYDIIEDNEASKIKGIVQDLIYWCNEEDIKKFLEVNDVLYDEEKEELEQSDNTRAFTDYLYDLIDDEAVNYKEMAKSLVYWCNDKSLHEFMKVRDLLPEEEEDESLNEGADSSAPFTVEFFHGDDAHSGIIYASNKMEAKEKFNRYCPSCKLDAVRPGRLGFDYPLITSKFETEQGWGTKDESLNESFDRDYRTVGDLLDGAIGNLSNDEIDRDTKLYYSIARQFGLKYPDNLIVYIDYEHQYDPDDVLDAINVTNKKDYSVYNFNDSTICKNTLNGIDFLFFYNEDEADEYLDTVDVEYLENLNESLNEDINAENAARVVQEVIKHKYGFDVDVATYKDTEESKCVIVEFIASKENCAKMRYDDLKEEVYKRLGSDINISCKQFSSPNLKNKGTEYKLKLFIIKEKKDKSKIYAESYIPAEGTYNGRNIYFDCNGSARYCEDCKRVSNYKSKSNKKLKKEQSNKSVEDKNQSLTDERLGKGKVTKMKVIREAYNSDWEDGIITAKLPQIILDEAGISKKNFTSTNNKGVTKIDIQKLHTAILKLGKFFNSKFDGFVWIPGSPNALGDFKYNITYDQNDDSWIADIKGKKEDIYAFKNEFDIESPVFSRMSKELWDAEDRFISDVDLYDIILRDLSDEYNNYNTSIARRIPRLKTDTTHTRYNIPLVLDRYHMPKKDGTGKDESEIELLDSGIAIHPKHGHTIDFARQVADEFNDYDITTQELDDGGLLIEIPSKYWGVDLRTEENRRKKAKYGNKSGENESLKKNKSYSFCKSKSIKESVDDRKYTNMLLDMIDNDEVDAKKLAGDLVIWTSEDDIKRFMQIYELIDDDIDEALNEYTNKDKKTWALEKYDSLMEKGKKNWNEDDWDAYNYIMNCWGESDYQNLFDESKSRKRVCKSLNEEENFPKYNTRKDVDDDYCIIIRESAPEKLLDAIGIAPFEEDDTLDRGTRKDRKQEYIDSSLQKIDAFLRKNFDHIKLGNADDAKLTRDGELTNFDINGAYIKELEEFAKFFDLDANKIKDTDNDDMNIYDLLVNELSVEMGISSGDSGKRRLPTKDVDPAYAYNDDEIVPNGVRYHLSLDPDSNEIITDSQTGDIIISPINDFKQKLDKHGHTVDVLDKDGNKVRAHGAKFDRSVVGEKTLLAAEKIADKYSDYGVTCKREKNRDGNEVLRISFPDKYVDVDLRDEEERRQKEFRANSEYGKLPDKASQKAWREKQKQGWDDKFRKSYRNYLRPEDFDRISDSNASDDE